MIIEGSGSGYGSLPRTSRCGSNTGSRCLFLIAEHLSWSKVYSAALVEGLLKHFQAMDLHGLLVLFVNTLGFLPYLLFLCFVHVFFALQYMIATYILHIIYFLRGLPAFCFLLQLTDSDFQKGRILIRILSSAFKKKTWLFWFGDILNHISC